jgi:uncharacterized protein YukE
MKKLNKEQLKAKNDYSKKVIDNFTKLEKAIADFNAKVAEAFMEVSVAVDDYNGVVEEANGWLADLQSEMQSYADEKSDKWREGDAGQAYESWMSEYEGAELNAVEISEPEALDTPDDETAKLADLPEEP